MFGNIARIFGNANEKFLKQLNSLVERINSLERDFKDLKDGDLPEKTQEFKERLKKGETLDDLLPEAFALVREAAKRTLNQRHYDVQLLGGIILHQGKIAEMKTGEGKTLVATLPAYLNALLEKGAHIVTVNDYLSRRDAVWMGQIYHILGLKVGCLNHEASYLYDPIYKNQENEQNKFQNKLDEIRDTEGSFKVVHEFLRPCSRKEAYEADITYGTNNEFGFDYLRDNMAYDLAQVSQKNHYFAVVDEVDSILIDEARTPLIISAPDEESGELYRNFSKIAPRLQKGADYNVDEKMKAVIITDGGIGKVEKILGVENIYTEKGIKYVHHLEQALRAQALFQRDRDYVVKNNEVLIVDEFTGRLMPGRRWSDGLHQAIEAKEGVSVQRESRTMASITFQNYFRMYEKLSGMTGTALTSAEEFHKVYNLEVLAVPTNKPLIRKNFSDKIFQTEKGKFQAVVEKIKECRKKNQPILVGTVSIKKNEKLSALLTREGVPHKLLNAKNHEKEGAIIAQAGRPGAVTIATNMAGRGVDILLGGNPALPGEADKVREAGGLFVMGTERHEARRIDNQLRGRAGRQGDPGQTQFLVSLEDDLMRVFGSEKIKKMMGAFGIPENEPIENKIVSRALESAQAKIEGFNFDARRHILEYDDVMNRQRQLIYRRRREILVGQGGEIEKRAAELVEDELTDLIDFHAQGDTAEWKIKEISENLRARLETDESVGRELIKITESGESTNEIREKIKDYVLELWRNFLAKKKKDLGEENFSRLLKMLMIQIMDMLWVGHLEAMDYLRSSVRLRAYGQHDPLIEYKNEGARIFKELEAAIRAHLSHLILKISGQPTLSTTKSREIQQSGKKAGRNDPCPCGSGKKYKKCHGQ
ncbi:MAG: preprotein translocase subunit SecA [Candidatus Niyogibacteria bacterium]|nr:preprotein translocase subunit SecA [Candidatus Niyogibacteria bacterium]